MPSIVKIFGAGSVRPGIKYRSFVEYIPLGLRLALLSGVHHPPRIVD